MNTPIARRRRAAIAKAAHAWIEARADDPLDEEADIDLEHALNRSIRGLSDDTIEEIWSDSPESLMLRVGDGTIIEIDVESGNYLRGTTDEA